VRAVEQRLCRAKRRGHVPSPPGVGDGEDRSLGASDRQLFDACPSDLLAVGPGREFLNLGCEIADIVTDSLDERAAGVTVGGRTEACELLGDPFGQLLLRHVVRQDLTCLRDQLGERGVSLDPVADEREDRGRSRSSEVRLELLRVGRLPGLDTVDDDESRLSAEKAEGVAGGDRVFARRLRGVKLLDRVFTDPAPQALERDRDLRPVRPRQEVDRLQLVLARHAAKHRRRRRPLPDRERQRHDPR
jgi:hypothetical protein